MITITEALAETKTITARIDKTQEALLRYVVRDSRMRDPLEADGGSVDFVKRGRQSIRDLEERLVLIRTAIQQTNLTTVLTVGETSRTVSAWLNWRREVSEGHKRRLQTLVQILTQARQKAAQAGAQMVAGDTSAKPGDIIVAISEKALSEDIERLEIVLGDLDGKLSLLNATTLLPL